MARKPQPPLVCTGIYMPDGRPATDAEVRERVIHMHAAMIGDRRRAEALSADTPEMEPAR